MTTWPRSDSNFVPINDLKLRSKRKKKRSGEYKKCMTPLFAYLALLVLIFIIMVLAGLYQIGGKLKDFGSVVLNGLADLLAQIETLGQFILGQVTNFANALGNVFTSTVTILESGTTESIAVISDTVGSLVNVYGSQLVNLIDLMGNVGNQLYSLMVSYGTNVLDVVSQISQQYIGSLLNFLQFVIQQIVDFLKPLLDFVEQGFDFWYNNVVEPIATLMSQFLGSMLPMLISILKSLREIFDGGLGKALSFLGL